MKFFAVIAAALVLCGCAAQGAQSADSLSARLSGRVSVYLPEEKRVAELDFDEFITGCICGVLPKSGGCYSAETLCALAAVFNTNARIYLEKNSEKCGRAENFYADFLPCEALPFVSFNEKAVNHADRRLIRAAVKNAGGAYLDIDFKNAEYIEFCKISTGKTTECEYSPSVSLPEDILADGYLGSKAFSIAEISEAFGVDPNSFSPENWFRDTVYDECGVVFSVNIDGKLFGGDEIKTALALRSAAFSVKYDFERFYFETRGLGNNRGMSLSSAEKMAGEGKNFKEILRKFYNSELISD